MYLRGKRNKALHPYRTKGNVPSTWGSESRLCFPLRPAPHSPGFGWKKPLLDLPSHSSWCQEGLAGVLRTADCLSVYPLWGRRAKDSSFILEMLGGSGRVRELLLCVIVPLSSLPPCRKRWAEYRLPKNQGMRDFWLEIPSLLGSLWVSEFVC